MKPEDVGKLVKEKGIKIVDLKFNDLPEIDAYVSYRIPTSFISISTFRFAIL